MGKFSIVTETLGTNWSTELHDQKKYKMGALSHFQKQEDSLELPFFIHTVCWRNCLYFMVWYM